MNAAECLFHLVAFAPVTGGPNTAITRWIGTQLDQAGAQVRMIPGPEADRVNIFATFGPRDRAGLILSGHMDVVPAQAEDWGSDPFVLTDRAGRLHARGSSDMLGFLACVLAIAPELGRRTSGPPVHIAFSYDEEMGCRGVPHLLARLPDLCAPVSGAVIGEPTNLIPVRGHKGKAAIGIRVMGRGGHSARPDLGLNAIHGLAPVLDEVVATARALRSGPQSADFAPPWSTVQAGVIAGGQAVNIIPDLATLEIEARAIPGVDPLALLAPVLTRLEALTAEGYGVEHVLRSSYPALQLAADHPMVARIEAAAEQTALAAVSFGTEAGLFQQAGVPAVICGPGDIGRAHKPDEYITRDELDAGVAFLRNLVESLG